MGHPAQGTPSLSLPLRDNNIDCHRVLVAGDLQHEPQILAAQMPLAHQLTVHRLRRCQSCSRDARGWTCGAAG